MMNCSAVEKVRSQFFQSLRCFSSHAKLLSTTHRLGITANVCISLCLTTDTSICFPKRAFTPSVNGFQFWKNFRRNTPLAAAFQQIRYGAKLLQINLLFSERSFYVRFLILSGSVQIALSLCRLDISFSFFYSIFLRV